MKTRIIISIVAITAILGGTSALAGNVKVDLNFSLGGLYPPIVVREEVYRPPVAVRYNIEPNYPAIDEVRFIYPDELGFYVAVGVPYELCFINNNYYLFQDGRWLRSSNRRGPWLTTHDRYLPTVLRQHRIDRIRDYRRHGYDRMQEMERHRGQGQNHYWNDYRGRYDYRDRYDDHRKDDHRNNHEDRVGNNHHER